MDYASSLSDFIRLREIANGYPYDGGAILEEVAEALLLYPTKKRARDCLNSLINHYYRRGDAQGHSLTEHSEAREIFRRHGLLD